VKLLALECATEHCSVALWLDGELRERSADAQGAGHGEALLPMVQGLLQEAGLDLAQLDGIAVSRGPGAFTGVRLGISVAQGLAFSVGLPVFGCSTLQAVAAAALQADPGCQAVLVCQDARMGELYAASFVRDPAAEGVPVALGAERLCKPGDVGRLDMTPGWDWCGAGSGFDAYPALRAGGVVPLRWLPGLWPRAAQVARLAAAAGPAAGLDPALLQPVYLRDEVAQRSSKN